MTSAEPFGSPNAGKSLVSFECLAGRKSSDCGQTVERGDGTQTVAPRRLEAELGASERSFWSRPVSSGGEDVAGVLIWLFTFATTSESVTQC